MAPLGHRRRSRALVVSMRHGASPQEFRSEIQADFLAFGLRLAVHTCTLSKLSQQNSHSVNFFSPTFCQMIASACRLFPALFNQFQIHVTPERPANPRSVYHGCAFALWTNRGDCAFRPGLELADMFEKLADLAELEPQGQKDLSPWFETKLVRRTWPVNFVFARSLCLLGQ